MSKHLIFVYGTLRRGGARPMLESFPEAQFVETAEIRGSLYDLGAYPGLLLEESNLLVSGEVYEVDDELLSKLDEFEASSHYRRRPVELSLGSHRRVGWVYEPRPEFYSFQTLIPSGDWIAYAQTKTDGPETAWPDEAHN